MPLQRTATFIRTPGDGTAAWTGISGEAVIKGVQAIWSEADSEWSLIASGWRCCCLVTGQDPIEVDIATNGASARRLSRLRTAAKAKRVPSSWPLTRRLKMALPVLQCRHHSWHLLWLILMPCQMAPLQVI